jgi:hypothetical protein
MARYQGVYTPADYEKKIAYGVVTWILIVAIGGWGIISLTQGNLQTGLIFTGIGLLLIWLERIGRRRMKRDFG